MEVRAEDGSWKADVLATDNAGRRLAIEVQLSPQTDADYLYRTQRYLDDGVLPVWITNRDRPEMFGTYRIAHAIAPTVGSITWLAAQPLSIGATTREPGQPSRHTTIRDFLRSVTDRVDDWPWHGESVVGRPLSETHPRIASEWDPDGNRGDIHLKDANQQPVRYRYNASPSPDRGRITIAGPHAWAPLHRADPGSELAWLITEHSLYDADWICTRGHRTRASVKERMSSGGRCPDCVLERTPTTPAASRPATVTTKFRGDPTKIPHPTEPVTTELSKPSFLAVRIQTANKHHASVCVLGVARVIDGKVARTAHTYIRPADPYFQVAEDRKQRHLTLSMLANAPTIETVGAWLLQNAAGTPLVGHQTTLQMDALRSAWGSWPGLPELPALWHIDLEKAAVPTVHVATANQLGDLHKALLGTRGTQSQNLGENAEKRAALAANIAIALVQQHGVNLSAHVQADT